MELEKPEIYHHTIVLRGDFNPKIFQPYWFAAEKLIQKKEAEEAKIEIIHNDVVAFAVDWWKLQVIQERLEFQTTQENYFEPLRDLVVGTFQLLEHTPVRMMGINWNMHFRKRTGEEWHAVGNRLAPKELWSSVIEMPGMYSLSIQGKRTYNTHKGYIIAKVEPSRRIDPGVFFNINDHFEVSDPQSVLGCKEILDILKDSWTNSKQNALKISTRILEER